MHIRKKEKMSLDLLLAVVASVKNWKLNENFYGTLYAENGSTTFFKIFKFTSSPMEGRTNKFIRNVLDGVKVISEQHE
jgi:hypothetical protein